MSAQSKSVKKRGHKQSSQNKALALTRCKSFPLAQRGVKNSGELTQFHTALLSDIYSGMTLETVDRALKVTGQIIAHENLKLRSGIKRGFLTLGK